MVHGRRPGPEDMYNARHFETMVTFCMARTPDILHVSVPGWSFQCVQRALQELRRALVGPSDPCRGNTVQGFK